MRPRQALNVIIILFFAFIVAMLVLTSCAQRVTERLVAVHDTTYLSRVERDSIYMRDSIYLHEYVMGDTVYREKTSVVYRWRDRLKTDTIYISRTDTATTITTVEKAVRPTLWERLREAAALMVVFSIILLFICILLRNK